MNHLLLFLCIFYSFSFIHAQEEILFDSIQQITQTTYTQEGNQRYISSIKHTYFDTNRIVIRKERIHYKPSDTGDVKTSYYLLEYNPETRLGEHYTERFPHPNHKKSHYSKQSTRFKCYNHKRDYLWSKQYDKAGNLAKESTFKYNNQGLRTEASLKDHTYDSPITHIDKTKYNKAGKAIVWEAFDEENGKKKKVRDFRWTYEKDTLLLSLEGHLYGRWNQTHNVYKNGIIKKSTTKVGRRQDNGKIIFDYQNLKVYKDGLLYKETEYPYMKKGATTTYTRSEGYELATMVTKEATTTKSVKESFSNNLCTKRERYVDGELTFSETFVYNATILIEHTEIEHRKSGKKWKTITKYDEKGLITQKTFFVDDQLKQEDIYQYE